MVKISLGSIFALAMALAPMLAPTVLAQEVSERAVTVCTEAGGTIRGKMCRLDDGRSCEATAFARTGECFDADGKLVGEGGSSSDY